MGTTSSMRSQHRKLIDHVHAIRKHLATSIDPMRARIIRCEISKMAGLFNFHFSMEDKVLYPKLLRHQDGKVASMAKRLSEEMAGIKEKFTDYRKKWLTTGAIESKPGEFTMETNLLFLALGERILREDRELYPILEILGM